MAGAAHPMSDGGSLAGEGGRPIDTNPFVAGAFAGGTGGSAGAGDPGGDAGNSGGVPSSAGISGDAGSASVEPTHLCDLATLGGQDPFDQSSLIGSSYRQVIAQECRYAGLNCGVDINDKIDFANGLRAYGPQLWHCSGLVASEFRLIYRGRSVTQADGEALVDAYVTLTMRKLLLSDSDALALRKELLALMSPFVAADAAAISLCDSGGKCPASGGAGGSGAGGASSQARAN